MHPLSLPMAAAATGLVTASLWFAPSGWAEPSDFPQPGSQPADAILMELEGLGYAVGINWLNGREGEPLSQCQVTGYHAPDRSGGQDPTSLTVYLDVVCPDGD